MTICFSCLLLSKILEADSIINGGERAVISISRNFLFIHVPKTGGNSIQNILKEYSEDQVVAISPMQDGLERFEVKNEKFNITKHSKLSRYKRELDADVFRRLFKFATIRNPWDRMISYYFSPGHGVTKWDRVDFIRVVQKVPALRSYISEKTLLQRIKIPVPWLQKPLGTEIDFLIRFEQIDEDFKTVCERINIPYVSLPKRNRSERKHYSLYYDDELKALVAQKFKEEIALGGYTFQSV